MSLALIPLTLAAIINLNALSVNPGEAQMGVIIESEPTLEVVEVEHKQRGMLLALLPITFTVKARADARGRVEMEYPWYSKFTVDRRGEVETMAKIAVNNAIKEGLIGSVTAAGESKNPYFSATEAETVEKVLISVLEKALDEFD